MRYLPIHIDTQDINIAVFGGGPAAEAKLCTLVKSEANITVFAAQVSAEISKWQGQNRIKVSDSDFNSIQLDGHDLIYIATEDSSQNSKIAKIARAAGIFVNVADQKDDCNFITPAILDRDPVTISIGTAGTSPGLARSIKSDLEERLPADLGKFALLVQILRSKVKQKLPKLSDRQRFWSAIFSSNNPGIQTQYDRDEVSRKVERLMNADIDRNSGQVVLVGAGPGNPDLLTIGAKRAIGNADVVIYDRLVTQDILDIGRREAEYIYVGKTPGEKSISQAAINEILIEKATDGQQVIRLKSGDPLIFGRADEEIEALIEADIPYSIEPGITSASAAAAEIGVSLTTRGHNKSVSFLTGHDAKGFAEQDWAGLSAPDARAVVYMGVGAARFIQGRLLLHGAPASLPITVVENASRRNQIVVQTTLQSLPSDLQETGIKGPAVLLIGYRSRNHFQTPAIQEAVGQ